MKSTYCSAKLLILGLRASDFSHQSGLFESVVRNGCMVYRVASKTRKSAPEVHVMWRDRGQLLSPTGSLTGSPTDTSASSSSLPILKPDSRRRSRARYGWVPVLSGHHSYAKRLEVVDLLAALYSACSAYVPRVQWSIHPF